MGVEWSRVPYWIAKWRGRGLKNITILRQDMFKYDYSEANIIICFLIKHLMKRFTEKLNADLRKKSYVFSNRFPLEKIEPIEVMDLGDHFSYIHLYKILPLGAEKYKPKTRSKKK